MNNLVVIFTNQQQHATPDLQVESVANNIISEFNQGLANNFYVYTSTNLVITALRGLRKNNKFVMLDNFYIIIIPEWNSKLSIEQEIEMFNNATLHKIDKEGRFIDYVPYDLNVAHRLLNKLVVF